MLIHSAGFVNGKHSGSDRVINNPCSNINNLSRNGIANCIFNAWDEQLCVGHVRNQKLWKSVKHLSSQLQVFCKRLFTKIWKPCGIWVFQVSHFVYLHVALSHVYFVKPSWCVIPSLKATDIFCCLSAPLASGLIRWQDFYIAREKSVRFCVAKCTFNQWL